MKNVCTLVLLLLSINSIFAQVSPIRNYIFGHSLLDHRPPINPTPSDETTVPHWMYLLAQEAGYDYYAGGQYGFLPQHANVPPNAQWGYDIVPGVWDQDYESFADADINTILITAGNFMQWQAPDVDYPSDPGLSPVSATLQVFDWVEAQGDAPRYYIYENWPDMAGYLANDFPPTTSEFQAYSDYTNGAFHQWWIDYQDLVLAQRPDLNVKMIPVGPIIDRVIQETWSGQNIPFLQLYEDDAPHGRPSIYFLAALTTYMAIQEEKAPISFLIPNVVHPDIQQNYSGIIDLIWDELLAFHFPSGESRVFFNQPNSIYIRDTPKDCWGPNPGFGELLFYGNQAAERIRIFNHTGQLVRSIQKLEPKGLINLEALPAGAYFLQYQSAFSKQLQYFTWIKQ
ncbi:MAG: T9SS type A sorting domain-containing protein [Bacteroidota bacterium]